MKRHANEFLRTSSGRLAGSGILYDNYDDEATLKTHPPQANPIHKKEYIEYIKGLKEEQPVKIWKLNKEELEEYLKSINIINRRTSMTRYENIRNLSVEQMAKIIIESNITDKYCKSDCGYTDTVFDCECKPEIELKCCINWLNEEV